MSGCYFISYSRVDATALARRLADELVAGSPSYAVWLDEPDIRAGCDWDNQIRDAIQACRGVLFLMTSDSVQDHSACKLEWAWALKYKKPVVPLRIEASAALPFRLSSLQYIDFSGGFDVGLAGLRAYLRWVGSPEWVLQDLRDQLAAAEREVPRADPARLPRVLQDVQELRQRVADQSRMLADPHTAIRHAEERIAAGLEHERQPERQSATPAQVKFVNPPPVTAPSYFQDRRVESELLSAFLRADDERIMTVVGRGGVGKTAMVCRLLKALEGGRLPDDLGELQMDGIVYLSPDGAHTVNFPNLFTDLCRLLPALAADRMLERYRDPHQTPGAVMLSLLDSFPSGRIIVLLDSVDDVIETDSGIFAITDTALDEALRALLSAPVHGIKVLLTTRVAPRALLLVHPERQRRLDLDEGLDSPYAEQVLRARDPDGRLGLRDAPDELLARARQRTRGYPRALEALVAILAADRDTTLPDLLAEATELPENVVEALVGEAFNRLDAPTQQVMQALAIYPVPVPPVAVDYLLQPYQPAVDSAPMLARLVNMQFVRREAGRYYLHQVDREYALSRLQTGAASDRDAAPAPFTQQALRYRGAGYFEQIRTPPVAWKTLDDLIPQLAEFELRYQSEDYDTAAQVLLGIDYNYLIQWGHVQLTAEMHQRLQDHVHDPWAKAASKCNLGTCYRALGRITPARELYQQALAITRAVGDRPAEAIYLSALGGCSYDLGQIPQAIELYERALCIACETGYRAGEANNRGNVGNCYYLIGQVPQAMELYQQALAIDRETGDQDGEAIHLAGMGNCYADLGQTHQAIALQQQVLALDRRLGHRYGEAIALANLGDLHGDLELWDQGIWYCRQAMDVADEISSTHGQSLARRTLARIELLTGDLPAVRQAVDAARNYDYPRHRARLSLLSGIAQLLQGELAAATKDFHAAITQSDEELHHTSSAFRTLDTKALALCGLALTTGPEKAMEATTVFLGARKIASAKGVVSQTMSLFNVLTTADRSDILTAIRPAIADPANQLGPSHPSEFGLLP